MYAGIDLYCLSLGLSGLCEALLAMKKARRMAGWRAGGLEGWMAVVLFGPKPFSG